MKIPNEYEMFSSQGNKSIKKKFELLLKGLDEKEEYSAKLKEVEKFLKKYVRMFDTKNYGESSDTAVREIVWVTLYEICKVYNLNIDLVDELWNSLI